MGYFNKAQFNKERVSIHSVTGLLKFMTQKVEGRRSCCSETCKG